MKGIMAALQRQFAAIPGGDHLPVQHSDAVRIRRGFGIQLPAPGSQRLADGRATGRAGTEVHRGRHGSGPSWAPSSPPSTRTIRRSRSTWIARRRARWACRSMKSSRRCRAAMGGAYVNDFNRFGRLYRVYVQADADARLKADDIGKIYVRSKTTNEMVPLSTLVTIKDIAGTELTTRFNLLRSVEIQGAPAPRIHLGAGAGRARAGLRGDDAEGDGLCLLVDCPIRKRSRRPPRRPSSWPSSACSCCWPRCTKAGGCPGRCCWARRWWRWAPSLASG